jgi:PAS domain-containing protein
MYICDVLKIYNVLTKEKVKIDYNEIVEKNINRGLPENPVVYTKKGIKYLSASFSRIITNDRVEGILILFSDITKIMKREQMFREYAEALNKTLIGIIISNEEFQIEYINPRVREIGNYSEEI